MKDIRTVKGFPDMVDVSLPIRSRAATLIARLDTLLQRLTVPFVPMQSVEDRLKAQWLALVLLTIMPIGLVLSSSPLLFMPSIQSAQQIPSITISLILIVCLVPFYFLCRLGYFKLVAGLAVVSSIVAIWVSVTANNSPWPQTLAVTMLLMPILFVGILFSRKASIAVSIVILLSLPLLPTVVPTLSYSAIINGPFEVLLLGAGVSILGTTLRDKLEQYHTNALTATNAALQAEIAERQKVETMLRESNERYQAVMMQTAACIFLADITTKQIIEANPAFLNLLGYSEVEGQDMTLYDFVAHDPASIDERTRLIETQGSYYIGERCYRTKDGSLIDMDVRANLIRYAGKVVMCVVAHDISARKHMDEQLRASLQEKETLLKEVHHRVKNNLQIISSLLNLQSAKLDDPFVLAQFQDSQSRIRAMAHIHEQLYRSDDLAHIDFEHYLRELTNTLAQTYQRQDQAITIQVKASNILLDIDTAIPCGLLVNELVSNALKHAFPDRRDGTVIVELRHEKESPDQLVVRDNGIGFPDGLDYHNTSSLGLKLVNSLARQLGGSVELRNMDGTVVTTYFGENAAKSATSRSNYDEPPNPASGR